MFSGHDEADALWKKEKAASRRKRKKAKKAKAAPIRDRKRMIFDLPEYVQMAIRLRAVKAQCLTSEVIQFAMERAFPAEVAEAERAIKEAEHGS